MTELERLRERCEQMGTTLIDDGSGDWFTLELGNVPDVKLTFFRISGVEAAHVLLDWWERRDWKEDE